MRFSNYCWPNDPSWLIQFLDTFAPLETATNTAKWSQLPPDSTNTGAQIDLGGWALSVFMRADFACYINRYRMKYHEVPEVCPFSIPKKTGFGRAASSAPKCPTAWCRGHRLNYATICPRFVDKWCILLMVLHKSEGIVMFDIHI